VAIIAATYVEDRLQQGIISRLRRDSAFTRDIIETLFHPSGPLGTFSTKIRLAFLLRIYGRQVYHELTAIKDVRNKFAHIIGENALLSFQSPEIVKLCGKLKLIENYVRPMAEFTFITETVEAVRRSGISFSDNPAPSETLDNSRRRYTETCGLLSERFQDPDHPRDPALPRDEFLILGDEPYPLP